MTIFQLSKLKIQKTIETYISNNTIKTLVKSALKMTNEEILAKANTKDGLKKNGGRRYDVCLMNPPYSSIENGGYLDIKFLDKCTDLSKITISIQPGKMASNAKIYRKYFDRKHIESIELITPQNAFGISSLGSWKYVGIYTVNSESKYDDIKFILDGEEKIIKNDETSLKEFVDSFDTSKNKLKQLLKKFENLYNELMDKYNPITQDNSDFIYEENHPPRGKVAKIIKKSYQIKLDRVRTYLKTGKYKYCVYKGSFNNDKVKEWNGENPDDIFKGQICWLTNKENVKNNIKYWMESTLFNMWREGYLGRGGNCYAFNMLPGLNFDMKEDEFKSFVDSLVKFDKEDIKILKEYNIRNADKL